MRKGGGRRAGRYKKPREVVKYGGVILVWKHIWRVEREVYGIDRKRDEYFINDTTFRRTF